jgi:DNA phosphorothioation-associated putative methyltransferase
VRRLPRLHRRPAGRDSHDWDAITRSKTEDRLVYLALGRFRRRPPISALSVGLQRDIRAIFSSYSNACRLADDRLFQAVGKLLPNALYVHRSALEALDPLLRVYEGCARAYLGEIAGANLIKLHRQTGKVSYLVYPDFETEPHPALLRSIKLNLRSREIESLDYAGSATPPILHRKGTFLPPDHPLRAKFERLTREEERAGLLDETATIGTRSGWSDRLSSMGYALRGHRLVRSKAGDEPTGSRPDDAAGDGSSQEESTG